MALKQQHISHLEADAVQAGAQAPVDDDGDAAAMRERRNLGW